MNTSPIFPKIPIIRKYNFIKIYGYLPDNLLGSKKIRREDVPPDRVTLFLNQPEVTGVLKAESMDFMDASTGCFFPENKNKSSSNPKLIPSMYRRERVNMPSRLQRV